MKESVLLNFYKGLHKVLIDEVNVKKVSHLIGVSEKGKVWLAFDGKDYFYEVGGIKTKPKNQEVLLELLDTIFDSM